MSIRTVSFYLSRAGITPSTKQKAGVQGDHNVTAVLFNIDSQLSNAILTEADGKKVFYRVEGINSAGGKSVTEPAEIKLVSEANNMVTYKLERWLTQYGGTVSIQLIISVLDVDSTEPYIDMYCFPIALELQDTPSGVDVDPSAPADVRISAVIAMQAAQRVNAIKEELEEYTPDQTYDSTSSNPQSGKAVAQAIDSAFQAGSTYIFDGGDAYSEVDVIFTRDSEVTPESENAVKSKGIYKAIANAVSAVKEWVENFIPDHPIEYGVLNGWNYEKWKSGKSVLWGYETAGGSGESTDAVEGWKTLSYTLNFPEALFIEKPTAHIQIEQQSAWYSINAVIQTLSENKMEYRIFRVQELPDGLTITRHIEVKGRWKE